ncbi:hypothetical protein VNI00_011437 [Paramarasmius palmivorus]|uniref:Major facilitator superfamily (MFS) profile domain-containing protein n=1 Tax=Paramarasmius palmivorus TaxID=297713 RepID=A0AAW0CCU8_9AGAR
MTKLRGRNVPEIDIRNEVYEIRAAYEEERRLVRGMSIMQLFHGSDCRRTLIAIGVQCLQQAQGVAFMLLALGFTNIYDVLIKVLSVNMIFVFLGFYLPDRFGRRPLLLIGTTLMALSMFTVSMISAFTDNKPTGVLGRLTLAAVIIWIVVFTLTWGPLPWIICSEVPSNYLREKTLAIASWSGFGVALISNLLTPYIQDAQYGDLQGRIGFVWCGFGVISFFFCYFLVPELRNRPLEELDILFNEGVPARKFSTYKVSLNPIEKGTMTPTLAYKEEKA